MKSAVNKPRKSGPLAVLALAVIALLSVLTWSAFRSGSAPVAPQRGVSAAKSGSDTAIAASSAREAPALPARQWKLGDSFVYQIDSTRQVSVAQNTQDKVAPAVPQ